MKPEYESIRHLKLSNKAIRVWRFSNSILLIAGLLLPWLNNTSAFRLFISTNNWLLIQNDQHIRIMFYIGLIVSVLCVITYPILNLFAAFNRSLFVFRRGLMISFSAQFLFIVLTSIYLASILQFKLLPVLSLGYWLFMIGLISSALRELQVWKPGTNESKKLVGFLIFASISCGLLLCASVLTAIFVNTEVNAKPTALINGVLINGVGVEALPNTTILVNARKIEFIGILDRQDIDKDYQIFDLHGKAILPGFINAHVHKGYDPGNLEIWVQSGVTTVCDLGAPVTFPFYLALELLQPYPHLSHLASAGPILTAPGGYPIAEHDLPSLTVNSVADARNKTGKLLDMGAELVKIALESRYGEGLEEKHAAGIVIETHRQRRLAAAHLGNLSDLEAGLRLDVDSLHHMIHEEISESTIQQMVDQDILWVPTMEVMYFFHGDKGQENVSRFIKQGGRLALGNDAGYFHGLQMGMPMREIELMYKAGLSPAEVIQAGTINAARVCQLGEMTGSLETGKAADLIVVDGNPLEQIEALEDVQLVMLSGVIVRSELK